MQESRKRPILAISALLVSITVLSGCGLFGRGAQPAPTPARALVPTFTPTPEGQVAAEEEVVQQALQDSGVQNPAADEVAQEQQPTEPSANQEQVAPTPEPPTPEPVEPTATPVPKLIVETDNSNVRNGPGTGYGVVGSVRAGQAFDISGKNPEGDWWQFCCLNGQVGWIYADLVSTENAESVAVAADIPEPPVAVAPPPQPQAQQPAPAEPTAAPAPPPSADPCAGIGGDGCKFRVSGGPNFASNGGTEIKLQILFKHSGVDGGQPQGSYFVVMMKDGAKLPISDGTRSIALESSEGPLGRYNYEYKIGIGDIPGNTVAGNYVMYVLDGNGERDSQNLNFSIPDGQGEVWVEWDQG